jgi:hypothetical protein
MATSLPIRRLAQRSGRGDKDVVTCEQGRLKLDTGDDYDLDELKEEAWHIMVERKAGSRIMDSHI